MQKSCQTVTRLVYTVKRLGIQHRRAEIVKLIKTTTKMSCWLRPDYCLRQNFGRHNNSKAKADEQAEDLQDTDAMQTQYLF